MNINETLLNAINTPNLRWRYDLDESAVRCFLVPPKGTRFPMRQTQAKQIIKRSITTQHGKQVFLDFVGSLADFEYGIRKLAPKLRDHVVHAVLSFFLGIYLNENVLKHPLFAPPVNDLQWKLAGLLHDLGYPVQVANQLCKPFAAKINEIKQTLGVPHDEVSFTLLPKGFENLSNGLKAFELIQKCLDGWELQIDVRNEYERMISSGGICHGIISSLAILHVIDLLYQKYNPSREFSDVYSNYTNWNQKYFEEDVIPACSAIYIHNLPPACFVHARIDRERAPLAFLLKLSDSLQEWERPSLTNEKGLPATRFDIKMEDSRLILNCNVLNRIRRKIREEISLSLVCPDVEIS